MLKQCQADLGRREKNDKADARVLSDHAECCVGICEHPPRFSITFS